MNPGPVLSFLFFLAIYSCRSKNPEIMKEGALPDSFIISPVYPDSVYFSVNAQLRKQTVVNGNIAGFHNKTISTHEIYFQRFVEKQGGFRVIHCVGQGLETVTEDGKEYSMIRPFNDTLKFDELGIFEGEPGDPVDLIPLYPGHAVQRGEYWKPKAKIKIPMGSGTADYSFIIDTVYKDEKGSILAKITTRFTASLQPAKEFEEGKVTATGGGTILWDCSIHQRRETHLSATYHAVKGKSELSIQVNVDDELKVHAGKKLF